MIIKRNWTSLSWDQYFVCNPILWYTKAFLAHTWQLWPGYGRSNIFSVLIINQLISYLTMRSIRVRDGLVPNSCHTGFYDSAVRFFLKMCKFMVYTYWTMHFIIFQVTWQIKFTSGEAWYTSSLTGWKQQQSNNESSNQRQQKYLPMYYWTCQLVSRLEKITHWSVHQIAVPYKWYSHHDTNYNFC